MEVGRETHNLNLINKMTLCGKVFSTDHKTEDEHNIEDKISKLIKVLESWRKRPFPIFSRNMTLKTFRMSRLIYALQNSYLSEQSAT